VSYALPLSIAPYVNAGKSSYEDRQRAWSNQNGKAIGSEARGEKQRKKEKTSMGF
jgi:hypothetical protein